MSLNGSKCKIMHFGKVNPEKVYYFEENGKKLTLETTDVERDLGIMITNDGKWAAKVEVAVNRASWVLFRIRKTFRFFDMNLCKKLYPTFVRPHLEFASAAWNTLLKGEIKKVEGVQRRATGMVFELRGLEYEERLERLGYTDLDKRRKRGDLIQLYKITKGLEEVEIDANMNMGINNLGRPKRSHAYQIEKEISRGCSMRDGFLPNRTATTWNLLPPDVVEAETVVSFKSKLDAHWMSREMRRSVYRV